MPVATTTPAPFTSGGANPYGGQQTAQNIFGGNAQIDQQSQNLQQSNQQYPTLYPGQQGGDPFNVSQNVQNLPNPGNINQWTAGSGQQSAQTNTQNLTSGNSSTNVNDVLGLGPLIQQNAAYSTGLDQLKNVDLAKIARGNNPNFNNSSAALSNIANSSVPTYGTLNNIANSNLPTYQNLSDIASGNSPSFAANISNQIAQSVSGPQSTGAGAEANVRDAATAAANANAQNIANQVSATNTLGSPNNQYLGQQINAATNAGNLANQYLGEQVNAANDLGGLNNQYLGQQIAANSGLGTQNTNAATQLGNPYLGSNTNSLTNELSSGIANAINTRYAQGEGPTSTTTQSSGGGSVICTMMADTGLLSVAVLAAGNLLRKHASRRTYVGYRRFAKWYLSKCYIQKWGRWLAKQWGEHLIHIFLKQGKYNWYGSLTNKVMWPICWFIGGL